MYMTRGFRHEFGKRTVFGGLGLTAEPAQSVDASETDDAINTIDAPSADSMRGNSDTDASVNLSGRDLSRDLNGSPLPMGSGGRPKDVSPPGRSLTEPAEPENESSGGQRALHVLKQALPLMQKLLPLIDGNIAMALGNLLTPRPQSHVQVDLTPLESQVTRMQAMQQDLRGHITEHNTALKRVEDQLEMVKEASDRNTREQQEMIEDLRAIGSKVNLFAAILFGLLLVSVILNLFLFMHIRQVLP
jgi:hypothetical protein